MALLLVSSSPIQAQTPSVTIAASSTTICAGTSVTFTATPTNGGTAPTYVWKKGSTTISGATAATYTTSTLANADVITCVMTSNLANVSPTTATSTGITMTVGTPTTFVNSNTGATTCLGTAALSVNTTTAADIKWYNGANLMDIAVPTYITGTTTAGGNGNGAAANQLSSPERVFVDASGNTFIVDRNNHRVQKWASGATTGTTVAGGNGQGSAANQLNSPAGIYVDASGNIFIVDQYNHRIQKWAPGATTGTTVAGGNGQGVADDQLFYPSGVYVDASGNIFIADTNNGRIQKWESGATWGTTVVRGNDLPVYDFLNSPTDVFVDASGNIYIADAGNYRIQKWTPSSGTGTTGTTVAGGNGQGSAANQLSYATGIYVDGSGNIFIADRGNYRIQKWAPGATEGITVAGGGSQPGSAANELSMPSGVFVDASANIFIADQNNHRIQKWVLGALNTYTPTTDGSYTAVVTVNGCTMTTNAVVVNPTVSPSVLITASPSGAIAAGTSVTFTATPTNGGTTPTYQWKKGGTNISGATSATYTSTTLAGGDVISCDLTPSAEICASILTATSTGITITSTTPFVNSNIGATNCLGTAVLSVNTTTASDIKWYNNTTLMNTPLTYTTGTTVAGGNGYGSAANQLNYSPGVYVDASGNIFIADFGNNRIQKWAIGATEGTTVAGGNGYGSAANQLINPTAVFIDGSGNIFIADASNNRIQKWAPGATTGTTVAGSATGTAGSAANQLNSPYGVYVDASGNIFIADKNNHRIQKWAPGATTGTTVAGGNGQGATANRLNYPSGVYVDASGNIFIADKNNNRIQKWAPGATTGVTVAGGNGQGSAANQLDVPNSVYVDGSGNIFIADVGHIANVGNHRIQKWTPGATTGTTVAGGNGYGSAANQLFYPSGVYVDASGNIFIADTYNQRIQKWAPSSLLNTYTPTTEGSYTAVVTVNGNTTTTNAVVVNATVTPSVSIAASPSGAIAPGTSVTFTATPTNGGTTPTYQWKKGGTNISGATSATYTSTTLADGDVISCVLTPSSEICATTPTATSTGIPIVVNSATVTPSVSIAASTTTICAGTSVTFTATPTNGGTTPTYQWKKGSTDVGTNSATYTTTALVNGDIITCVMTSSLSNASPTTATSAGITMTWTTQIVNSNTGATACLGTATLSVNTTTASEIKWYNSTTLVNTAIGSTATTGTTVAGTGTPGWAANQLSSPFGVSVNASGNIFIADYDNNRIQKWAPGATTGTTVAGGNGEGSAADQLFYPSGVSVDASGNIFIADQANNRIQKWAPGATTGTTVAGSGTAGSGGSAANELSYPTGVYVDGSGNIFIADSYNHRIQKWAPGATTGTTVAGTGTEGSAVNQLNYPFGVYVDASGNIFIADQSNHRIQKWAPGATTGTTVAGSATGTGGSAANQLYSPSGVYVDASGNIFISDQGNHRIQKWAPGATTGTTVAGTGTEGSAANQLFYPSGVYVDASGNIFIADRGNNRIQKWGSSALLNTYTPTTAGSYTAVVTVNGCTTTTNAVVVNASVTPSVSIAASPSGAIASGTSVTFTATPTNGGTTPTYQWKKGGTDISGATSATYTSTTLANGEVITCVLTPSTEICATTPTTTSTGIPMVVNPATVTPSVSIVASATTICAGTSVTFTATPTNGGTPPQYQWKKGSENVGTNSPIYTTAALNNGDIISCVMTSSLSNASPTTATSEGIALTVNSAPIVAAISGNTSLNIGANTTLSSTTLGGVWSSSNSAIATVSTTGVVTGVAGGSVTISYAVTNGCGTTTVTQAMTVNFSTYCLTYKPVRTGNYVDVHVSLIANGSPFNLGDANLQFKYKSAVLSNPTLQSNTLTPTGRYNVVLATVIPPLGFPSDDALITLNSVFNGTVGQGFTINTSETEVAVIRFNIDNTNLSPNIRPYENGGLGMVVFDDNTFPTLLASTGSCGTYDFAFSTNFTYSAPAFCTSAEPQAVNVVGTSGGTYSSTTGLSLDATTGQITPATSTAGTYVVTYNIPSVGGGQAATTVTINASPTPNIAGLNAAYCKNVAAVNLVGNPVGGSFTIDGTTATSLDPSLLTANTHTVVYTYTGANTCSATATQTVTINALPTPSIVDLNAAYCKNVAAVTLVGNPVGGSFTIDATTATSLDPSLLTANTHTVVYNYTDANTCSATTTQSVLINAIPVITVQPTASTTVCLGSPINLSVGATGTGLTYQWKKGSNLLAGANAPVYQISAAALTDAATYSVEVSGTCSPNVLSENALVAINALPEAITGTPSVNETFTTTLSNVVSGGTWSSSNTAVATVNATTGVVTGVHFGTATITYSLTNACGTNTVTQLVTVARNKIVVGLKVFLEGPYSTDGYMSDFLRVEGRVPTVEPYTGMTGFTHKGDGGGEVINSSVLTVTGVNAITDWVFIELRSKTNPTTILSTRSALLQRDGDVVDLDGTSPVSFNDVLADNYYIAVRHGNHLGFRTSTAQPLTSTASTINFTNGSTTTAGTNALKIVGGVYMMYCGDGDSNGVVNAIDKNKVWLIQNGLSGYLKGDFDMNGVVNAIDINTYWLPNNSKIQQLDF